MRRAVLWVSGLASSVAGLFMLRVANYVLLLCTYDNLIVMSFLRLLVIILIFPRVMAPLDTVRP